MKTDTTKPNNKYSPLKFVVCTSEDKTADILDQWFSDQKISELNFRCKAWNSLVASANKISAPAIAAHLIQECVTLGLQKPEGLKLTYSRKAGCRCGCSPGYVGSLTSPHPTLSGKDVWVKDLELTDAAKKTLDLAIAKQTLNLVAEIKANS
jgi:hypothetical protein